jgi:ABC-type polysaccharide/polyol phosphate transport system ATPase subunit/polysaccharide pyruvyl transferase WcaK-like protein
MFSEGKPGMRGSGGPPGPPDGPGGPAATPPAVVSVRGLTKTYRLYDSPRDRLKEAIHPLRRSYHRDHDALCDVSFDIAKGEAVGIIGRNGSGKSTLLKIVTGVLTPTRGEVAVRGRVSAMLELGTGFNPEMTGLENVFLGGALMGYARKEMEAKLDDILGFADIGEYVRQPVKTYSSGMFVRLAFAVMTAMEPEILVLDEVLAVGDIAFQNKCLRMIARLAEDEGTTILFVTHDLNALRLLCGRALLLDKGRLDMDGPPLAAADRYTGLMFAGSSPARVEGLSVGIADGSGLFVDAVASRGPCSLVVDIDRLRIEKGLLLAVRFINLENRFGYRIETDRFRDLAGDIRGKRFVADFRDLNLPKGHYALNVSISDGTFVRRIRHLEEGVRFRVTESGDAPPFLSPEWREEGRRRRIALVGWWGWGNEGDRFIRESVGKALGDSFDVYPVETDFIPDEAALEKLNSFDALLVGGGGLFTTGPPKPFDTFPEWSDRLKVPFGFIGVGVQEIPPRYAETVRALAEGSFGFMVRDRESYDLVRPLSSRAERGHDLAFLYPRVIARGPDSSAVGVNLRVWDFGERWTYDNKGWCDAINALPGEKETVPLSFTPGLPDADAMRDIRGRHNERFAMELYRNLGILVGMRLHSLVFAVQNGIPVVGIAYVPKVRRFLEEVGLGEFCLGVGEHERLKAVCAEALRKSPEISETMMRYTESARRDLTAHFEVLKRRLSGL